MMVLDQLHAGLLIPDSFLHSRIFLTLCTLVALNTIVFAGLSLVHIIPRWINPSWFRTKAQRAETRSIYPDGPL
jgi:hypothetical protein